MTRVPHRRPEARRRLLQGASLIAVAVAWGPAARAQLASLRAAAHVSGAVAGVPSVAVPLVPGLATAAPNLTSALNRTLANAARAQQAVNLALQAQAAARQTAAALPSAVPNGLGVGGLQPVANPVTAASDATGLNTWQGAAQPTQTTAANGAVNVDVQQTASRAVLDWTTFNVGANTTLTFDQSQNGVAQPGWIALNRVVGQLDPTTGLRNPNLAPAPSQILGAVKSQGIVLVINQNGILFGATAQINTNSLIATSLEIGQQLNAANANIVANPSVRDQAFLTGGLLIPSPSTFSSQLEQVGVDNLGNLIAVEDPMLEGAVTVQAGAQITSGQGGYVILAAPDVVNAGILSSSQGQVSLASGRGLRLIASDGSAGSADPNVRGLISISQDVSPNSTPVPDSVTNIGLIQSSEGFASLVGSPNSTIINSGVITASTSVSRNGFVQIGGQNVLLAPGSTIAITPDDNGTIPQDPNSLADFKPSRVTIGGVLSTGDAVADGSIINVGAGSLIYAPNANVDIGSLPGPTNAPATTGRVFVDTGAAIDVSGLANVQIAASTNEVTIKPVTANETNDTPSQRSTLNGTSVTVDPRLSGVRSDGVAWVGSPLIPAQAFAQQVGVSASQLMTKGGNVILGAQGGTPGSADASDVIVKPGATIDVSGGWTTYAAGRVQTTELISANGTLVNIGNASPDEVYLGVYNGFTAVQPRYGISQTFANPLLFGGHYDLTYIQGADAGSLTLKSAQPSLEGTVYANAFTGPLQAQSAMAGTAASSVAGDTRRLQGAGAQLPAGGFLFIDEINGFSSLTGGDIEISPGATPNTTSALTFGQTIAASADGGAVAPAARPIDSFVAPAEQATLTLSAPALSAMGLGQLSLYTSGALKVDAGADVTLAPGGIFTAINGRSITVNGAVIAPGGAISLTTVHSDRGSAFNPTPQMAGDYDVTVNGQLSAAGRWVNDYANGGAPILGPGYINGGGVRIEVASREDALGSTASPGSGDVATVATTTAGLQPTATTDVSGSILIDGPQSLVDVSAGGYVAPNGALTLSARGGDVSLADNTTYFAFEVALPSSGGFGFLQASGYTQGFRVDGGALNALPINPSEIISRVAIGQDAVRGYGFTGGGVFSLITPAIAFSNAPATIGANLPLDFFSKAGFGAYDITSYGTGLFPNTFTNGYGGYNAVLATQILTVGSGQVLNLAQASYSPYPTGVQTAGLRNLASGGPLNSILTAAVQPDAYDQLPVALNFGGLIEFKVAPGGAVIGASGASLSASQVDNEGTIRLPGGSLQQNETLPDSYSNRTVYAESGLTSFPTAAASSLSGIFSINPDGSIDETAASTADPGLTNAELATTQTVYLTGDLPLGVGVNLAAGSITDLSGMAAINPHTTAVTQGRQAINGVVSGGGSLATAGSTTTSGATLFAVSPFDTNTAFSTATSSTQLPPNPSSVQNGLALMAAPGSTIRLNGTSANFDQLTASGRYVTSPQWSGGGSITAGAGYTLTGASIDAHGGAPEAGGGVLTVQNLTLTESDPAAPTANTLSARQIAAAGFGTLVVQGDLTTSGSPISLSLPRAFFLTGVPIAQTLLNGASALVDVQNTAELFPTFSGSGVLQINAPYIGLQGGYQVLGGPTYAADASTGTAGQVTLDAQALDVTGAVLFDQAVGQVNLNVAGDLRLIGVAPFQSAATPAAPSLVGQLAVNGDLNIAAAQLYPTTGSTFSITSAGATGAIAIRGGGAAPATPYAAGGALLIQAASIVQDGIVRAPVGSLTLGANANATLQGLPGAVFAPPTTSVQLGPGSLTSVSADGLSIPYGTTTDQLEYFFSPTSSSALSTPPAAVLSLAGQSVSVAPGATVDLKGGGDLFAYEFTPGIGGSRDVLNQFNADLFTSNGGYQYPDHRQVYAIVPGLSSAPAAVYDPIYSANYAGLYGPSQVGQSVRLDGGPGIAAGVYTLLPAQYAVLPGGMEVVEDTGALTVPVGASVVHLDRSVTVTGQFAGRDGTLQSTPHEFDIRSQAVVFDYSNIALTSASKTFTAQAASAGVTTPRLPADAGRLIVNPLNSLDLSGGFQTAAAGGGRGSEVDITAGQIQIVSTLGVPTSGLVQLAADQLTGLNASSLLIGGVRTDNADGATTLAVSSSQIAVANDAAHPLSAPDMVLAVDGPGAGLTFANGATLTASGADTTGQTGNYVIVGSATGQTGQGALVRVSNGPDRGLTRNLVQDVAPGGLAIGAATLAGTSVLLDSSGDVNLASQVALKASNLGIDAASIAFAPTAAGPGGLVLTPSLQAALGQTQTLTLRTPQPISLADGGYSFQNLTIDAPGLSLASATGAVTISASAVKLSSSAADAPTCADGSSLACGTGSFALVAQTLALGDSKFTGYDAAHTGAFQIYGAGGGVSLTAPGGVTYQGQGGLEVGAAPLALQTAFLGEAADASLMPAVSPTLPQWRIVTAGALTLSNPAGAPLPSVAGLPGASLTLSGASIAVANVDVRATAGALTLTSAQGVAIGAGATLEAPGYAKSFGDAADPYSVSAPGGQLAISAAAGDINLAPGSTLSVGGGEGAAGSLSLRAGQGQVTFGGTLNGVAPTSGASFALNEAGAFDLAGFVTATQGAFNGDVSVQTGAGDLTLNAGQTLTARNVGLTANGGAVSVGGTIDVSGVNGGDVSLFGATGLSLDSTAVIAARASGYGVNDTRQAAGGVVELGVAGAGALNVTSGALIDVGALNPNPRIVEGEIGPLITYNYVPGDRGGSLILRAPVNGGNGAETINVRFAGAAKGADSIVLEGYRAYDLGAVAAGGGFSGVSVAGGVATLDTTATGLPNFLADNAPGTLVDFIQTFNLAASYGALGGLASGANFHARPGVELDYAGGITLASNWNLGAGTVDVASAAAAGLMVPDPAQPGLYAVVPGAEAAVFANDTRLTYRVGGAVLGEPGVLSIKAGGQLNIAGSISDGFFTFADQTNQTFLNLAVGAGPQTLTGYISAACSSCATAPPYASNDSATAGAVSLAFPGATALRTDQAAAGANLIPYDAAANTPGAEGVGAAPGYAGDPIASAAMFPLVQTAAGARQVASWSYNLTGGGAAGPSPLAVAAGAPGGVTVQSNPAASSYSYGGASTPTLSDTLLFGVGSQQVSADQFVAAEEAATPSLNGTSLTRLSFSQAPAAIKPTLQANAKSFFSAHPGQYTFTGGSSAPTGVSTSLDLAGQFLQQVASQWTTLKSGYRLTPTNTPLQTISVTPLIRTGTGSIALAAAGDIDLRNGATPTYLDLNGQAADASSGFQLGGAAIYTAGALVTPGVVTAVDTTTGAAVTLDPSAFETLQDNVGVLDYGYGQGGSSVTSGLNVAGILVSDGVYADNGGGVSLNAGGSLLGRRDAYTEARISNAYGIQNNPQSSFIGWYDQPWRLGSVGAPGAATDTNILINPQLFTEGLGALGGGNVSVRAAGAVSDLTLVADTTVTTGAARGGVAAGQISQGLLTFGGGDVTVVAGGDLLGGRIDVASGVGTVSAGGAIASAGEVTLQALASTTAVDDTLRVRLTDATVDLSAHRDLTLEGVAPLGVLSNSRFQTSLNSNSYAASDYSTTAGISLVSNGSILLQNQNQDAVSDVILEFLSGLSVFQSTSFQPSANAVLPGSLTALALTGGLTLNGNSQVGGTLLTPSPSGTLTLAAGASIAPVNVAMLDSQPGPNPTLPAVFPNSTQSQLQAQHDPRNIHENDTTPNRVYAGADINEVALYTPKQTRVGAGRDILNMVFFGQNLHRNDVTRILAGRDITASTALEGRMIGQNIVQQSTVLGNLFVLGGPGTLMVEAGRNLGPFLTSVNLTSTLGESFAGGILTVGDTYNPNLPLQGASIYAEFGVGKGQDFSGLSSYYLDPANMSKLPDYLFAESLSSENVYVPDKTQPIYAPQLIAYMQANQPAALLAAFGTTSVSYAQAYQAFSALPPLQQQPFLLQVYFSELRLTSTPGPTFEQYTRGYTAVNLLFPASFGYTANNLGGGSNGANARVHTGDLDLRLATVETQYGGAIDILGPGGRVLAGSIVATAQQAARRYSVADALYAGEANPGLALLNRGLILRPYLEPIDSIPAGFEGVLTLRGGAISTFTDGDFVLNQSRLFTEEGGDVTMWSSNGDLNAGQGPKTSSNFPPVVVQFDLNGYGQVNQASSVTGAGIAAFESVPGETPPDVYLIAPRGTVDAGAAGVRVAGNLFVAALHVANADNFQVAGTAIGLPPTSTVVNVSPQTTAAANAAVQAAQDAISRAQGSGQDRSIITVEVLGFGDPNCVDPRRCSPDGSSH